MFSSYTRADDLITINYNIQPVYGYRLDGTPGRIVEIKLKGKKLQGDCLIDVLAKGCKEKMFYTECKRLHAYRTPASDHS